MKISVSQFALKDHFNGIQPCVKIHDFQRSLTDCNPYRHTTFHSFLPHQPIPNLGTKAAEEAEDEGQMDDEEYKWLWRNVRMEAVIPFTYI